MIATLTLNLTTNLTCCPIIDGYIWALAKNAVTQFGEQYQLFHFTYVLLFV